MPDSWTIDTSALSRINSNDDRDLWADRIERGLVSICTVTRLEMGFTARSASDWLRIDSTYPVSQLVPEHMTPAVEMRAMEVQRLLTARGHHRATSAIDLVTAASAEVHGHTLLHVDKDFELIAGVTGQTVERLAPGGR